MTSEGAVDLAAGTGRMRVSLAGLVDVDELEPPFELEWDEGEVVARVGARDRRLPRAEARESGGLIGRMPDEPAGLVALLARGGEATGLGTDVVGGRETIGYRLRFDLRTAGEAGVPAELSKAFAAGTGARSFAIEAWLDDASLPRRLGYVVELAEVRSGGRLILPERTVRATYELWAIGEALEPGPSGE